jgi:hypothetical protein
MPSAAKDIAVDLPRIVRLPLQDSEPPARVLNRRTCGVQHQREGMIAKRGMPIHLAEGLPPIRN